ncbi:MAG: aminomethyltransferase family protein [Planctomycetota bacterium]|nr:aminomethyltransferase family protein [Planctomycetota bacterium]
MPQKTPFHSRLSAANRTGIWKHWAGHLVAPAYQHSVTSEYYAIRNSAALLDTSPLFKYRFSGPGAEAVLRQAMVRDISAVAVGRAQYTCWCDQNGFVLQDGVILRLAKDDFLLTAAEPALRHFRGIASRLGVERETVQDISTDHGILALQGPLSRRILSRLTGAARGLRYFGATRCVIEGHEVVLSRTGYTGDLGYEIWIPRAGALAVLDALLEAGRGDNLTLMGTTALKMARVEAGLLLMDVDFHSARHAWVDAQRETPTELGWGWMLRGLEKGDRAFEGRASIERELERGSSRWTTLGLAVDVHDYERVHDAAGILAPRHEVYAETTMSLYRRNDTPWDHAGYATSFHYSSLLRRPLAIAKVPMDLAVSGTEVDLELTVIRRPHNVLARVQRAAFFNPARKTSSAEEDQGA